MIELDKKFYRKMAERHLAEYFASISRPLFPEVSNDSEAIVKFIRHPIPEKKPSPDEIKWRKLLAKLPDKRFYKLCEQVWSTCPECGR